jgi:N-dimethylarginine dimethylaminohydrolase
MTHRVLMCEPTHYGIEYEINPWMHRANRVDPARALEQWHGLYNALSAAGVSIEVIDQQPGLPDMTFTANAGVVRGRTFIPSNFRYPERQHEAEHFIRWFADRGYEIATIHEPHYWEGEGDVLASGRRALAGYRFRTELRALDHLDELLPLEVIRLELVDPRFYHLDTCLCPLSERDALFYPPAFSPEAQAELARCFPGLIPVVEAEALRFACNAFPAEGKLVMNAGCPRTMAAARTLGYECIEAPMDEFIKAGGSVKCLVLGLDTIA